MSEEEREFWSEYDRNVASYMREFPSLDLASVWSSVATVSINISSIYTPLTLNFNLPRT